VRIQGLSNFFGYPYYLRNGKSYSFQIWPVHSEGPSEQKPIKNFREKGAWAYPGTAQFFSGTPDYLRIQRVQLRNLNFACAFICSIGTKPVKTFGNSSRGRSQGLPKFFRAPIHTAHRAVIFAIAQLSSSFLFSIFTRFRDIAAFVLQNAIFSHPNCSLPQISPCFPRCRWIRFPTYVVVIHQRYRRTDDMRSQDRALHCSASRGKN